MKKGPEKGKVYEVVKRKLEMKSIGSVSLRLVDDQLKVSATSNCLPVNHIN